MCMYLGTLAATRTSRWSKGVYNRVHHVASRVRESDHRPQGCWLRIGAFRQGLSNMTCDFQAMNEVYAEVSVKGGAPDLQRPEVSCTGLMCLSQSTVLWKGSNAFPYLCWSSKSTDEGRCGINVWLN